MAAETIRLIEELSLCIGLQLHWCLFLNLDVTQYGWQDFKIGIITAWQSSFSAAELQPFQI